MGSVLDEDYKVNGVKRLRAVDSSTFKESQGTKPTTSYGFNVGKISRNLLSSQESPQPLEHSYNLQ